jgi:hypothetical protein
VRSWGILILSAACAGTSWAAAPACFAERTTLAHQPLHHPTAEKLEVGGIGPGQVVRVLRTQVGTSGWAAEVEILEPTRLVALVAVEALIVFARQEIEVVPSTMWWTKDFPLNVLDSDAKVPRACPMSECGALAHAVRCSDLRGTPPPTWRLGRCGGTLGHGAGPRYDRSVWWEKAFQARVGSRMYTFETGRDAGLLKLKGGMALIESFDHASGVRARASVDPKILQRGPLPDRLRSGVTFSCGLDAVFRPVPGASPRFLTRDVELAAAIGPKGPANPITTLRRGLEVMLVSSVGPYARIRARWGGATAEQTSLVLEGWVPAETLAKK